MLTLEKEEKHVEPSGMTCQPEFPPPCLVKTSTHTEPDKQGGTYILSGSTHIPAGWPTSPCGCANEANEAGVS